MSTILDCELMRFPNSGLYHYCLNIGWYVNDLLIKRGRPVLRTYVPATAANDFGSVDYCIIEKSWHRFFKPFLVNCRVWHAPFQSGRIVPDKKKNRDIKVLLTIHDLNALHEGKPRDEQLRSLAHTQKLIDASDALVCISEFTKSDVLKNCEVGNKPVYVIHNGTHKVKVSELSNNLSKSGRPFLFGMGYINSKKNFHVLLPLLEQNPELDMVITGKLDEPDYVSNMQLQARKLGLENRLHLTGPVSEEEKGWYLNNCFAFVHPSLAEGFGAPVVEAMIFGKPLFLSNKTSLPEIGGDAAFYFSSFEPGHMQKVFREGMQKYKDHNLSHAIMERGKKFDWQLSAEKYIEVYESLY